MSRGHPVTTIVPRTIDASSILGLQPPLIAEPKRSPDCSTTALHSAMQSPGLRVNHLHTTVVYLRGRPCFLGSAKTDTGPSSITTRLVDSTSRKHGVIRLTTFCNTKRGRYRGCIRTATTKTNKNMSTHDIVFCCLLLTPQTPSRHFSVADGYIYVYHPCNNRKIWKPVLSGESSLRFSHRAGANLCKSLCSYEPNGFTGAFSKPLEKNTIFIICS